MLAPINSGGVFDVARLKARHEELLKETGKPGFWDRQETAQATLKENDRINEQLAGFERLRAALDEARLFLSMAEEEGGGDNTEAARETEAATAELDNARSRFAKVLRMLQTNDDYVGELMEIRQGEEALKVVRDLAKQIHEASDMLNNFINTITPPQPGT